RDWRSVEHRADFRLVPTAGRGRQIDEEGVGYRRRGTLVPLLAQRTLQRLAAAVEQPHFHGIAFLSDAPAEPNASLGSRLTLKDLVVHRRQQRQFRFSRRR